MRRTIAIRYVRFTSTPAVCAMSCLRKEQSLATASPSGQIDRWRAFLFDLGTEEKRRRAVLHRTRPSGVRRDAVANVSSIPAGQLARLHPVCSPSEPRSLASASEGGVRANSRAVRLC